MALPTLPSLNVAGKNRLTQNDAFFPGDNGPGFQGFPPGYVDPWGNSGGGDGFDTWWNSVFGPSGTSNGFIFNGGGSSVPTGSTNGPQTGVTIQLPGVSLPGATLPGGSVTVPTPGSVLNSSVGSFFVLFPWGRIIAIIIGLILIIAGLYLTKTFQQTIVVGARKAGETIAA